MEFDRTDLENIIKNSPVFVRPELYAVAKLSDYPEVNAFCIARDDDEISIIIEESRLSLVQYTDVQSGFRLLEVRPALPFFALGFLAKITNTIAQKGLNVLAVSTFSKDYVLVRDEGLNMALEGLAGVGFIIKKISN